MKFIIKKPFVSEKAMDLGRMNKYVFLVDVEANSQEIKKEIERIYKVNVEAINIINLEGKVGKTGRVQRKKAAQKKAIITVKKGQTIEVLPK